MIVVYSKNKIPIRIGNDRWDHIASRHPEMQSQYSRIVETITDPDLLQRGDFDVSLAIRLYPSTPLTRKYLVVAYKEVSSRDGFLLTAYLTSSPSKRRHVLWKR